MLRFFIWYTQAFQAVTTCDPYLLDAVRVVESHGDDFAVSKSGCLGPYQICPRFSGVPRWALFVHPVARAEAARHIKYWRSRTRDTSLLLAGYRCGNDGLLGKCGQDYAKQVLFERARLIRRAHAIGVRRHRN